MGIRTRRALRKFLWVAAFLAPGLAVLLYAMMRYPFTRRDLAKILVMFTGPHLLAWSELALMLLAVRLKPRSAVIVVAISGLCLIAHAYLAFYPLSALGLLAQANPLWWVVTARLGFNAAWTMPVWLGLFVRWLVSTVGGGHGGATGQAQDSITEVLRQKRFLLKGAPGLVVLAVMVTTWVYVAVRERILVWRHPEARVVREYLDALAAGDYPAMARRLTVARYSGAGSEAFRVDYLAEAPLEDFGGNTERRDAFVAAKCHRALKDIRLSYIPHTARIADARPMLRRDRSVMPDWREVVVDAMRTRGAWDRQYFLVRSDLSDKLKIHRARLVPSGTPSVSGGPPWLASPIEYDADRLRRTPSAE